MVDHPPKVLLSRSNITLAPVLDRTRNHAKDKRQMIIHEGQDQFSGNFSRLRMLVSPREQFGNARPIVKGNNNNARNVSIPLIQRRLNEEDHSPRVQSRNMLNSPSHLPTMILQSQRRDEMNSDIMVLISKPQGRLDPISQGKNGIYSDYNSVDSQQNHPFKGKKNFSYPPDLDTAKLMIQENLAQGPVSGRNSSCIQVTNFSDQVVSVNHSRSALPLPTVYPQENM